MNQSVVFEEEAEESTQAPQPLQHHHKRAKTPNLKNIIQLTEENDTNNNQNGDRNIKAQSCEEQTCLVKIISCLLNIPNLFKRKNISKNNIKITGFDHYVQQFKNSKQKTNIVLPPQKRQRKVLVLDLDQTLIFSSYNKREIYDFQTEVNTNGKTKMVYTIERFGLEAFLFEMSKYYEIVVFTAGHRDYANKIIDKIDRKRRIEYRLYREHCLVLNGATFLKNIRILGRKIEDIIFVDDNIISGTLQPDNFYQIQPFKGNPKDRELIRLSAFLKYLHAQGQFTPIANLRKRYQELQIDVKEENISHFFKDITNASSDVPAIKRRRQYHHQKKNSELQTLAENKQELEATESTASQLASKL